MTNNKEILNHNIDSGFKYKFSIVCAVYNVEKYVEETILSIVNQDIGFKENVQLIMVDDCSADNSYDICRRYSELYPQNIIAIRLPQNSGNASTPRNEAMKYVEGKYINCTDSDDILSPQTLSTVWSFFEENSEETDVVAIPIKMFYNNDIKNVVENKRNSFIGKSNRIINLTEEWKCPISSVATIFCHARNKELFNFDPTIINGEDLMVANKILLKKRTLGVVAGCAYYYRQHVKDDTQESLIQQGQKKISWYTYSINKITLGMIEYALENYGELPKFYQYTLACDLQWRMIARKKAEMLLDKDELDEFYSSLMRAFVKFDYSVIMALPNLAITEKIYVLRKKYVTEYGKKQTKVDTDILANFPPTVHLTGFIRHTDGTVEILGDYNDILHDNLYELNASFNTKARVTVQVFKRTVKQYIHKDVLYVKRMFSVKFNLNEIKPYSALRFTFNYKKKKVKAGMTSAGRFPLNSEFYGNYFFVNNFVLSIRDNALRFDKKKIYSPITCELRYLRSIFKKTSDSKIKILIHRLAFKLLEPFFKNKKIWLVSDKADRADDNGEFFFKFLSKNKPAKDKCYYVINKNSSDFKRMNRYGECIDYLSYKHKILSLFASYLVSSHTHNDFRMPLGIYHKYMMDAVFKNRFIFLQHGIIKSDHSKILNKPNILIDMFVTSSKDEYDSIVKGNYGYSYKEVQLCGMARYDGLYSETEKLITIAPTWRYNLCGPMDAHTDVYPLKPEFDDSIYYNYFKSLLTNQRLMDAAEEYGYKIQFLPHPILFPHKEKFQVNPKIKVLGYGSSYKEVYAKSALMLTDYSSLVFDFAYLEKPIVYTLFDYFDKSNSYNSSGYYDHEKDGLGDVTYTLDDTVDCLIEYMKNDCKIKDKYLERIKKFYAYQDKNNARRIMESILKLEEQGVFGIR